MAKLPQSPRQAGDSTNGKAQVGEVQVALQELPQVSSDLTDGVDLHGGPCGFYARSKYSPLRVSTCSSARA
mgnify:CR=1 FL=1